VNAIESGEDMRVFQVELTKLFPVLEIVWQEYVKGDGRHSELFLY